jgi:acetylornithine deacetylase/succinyl-diaminopimelate desuccinylase-like protein
MEALGEAYGSPAGTMGTGGSIPLVARLQTISPHAEVMLWGAEDLAKSNIHASNESVDLAEIERLIVAQALTLRSLGGA